MDKIILKLNYTEVCVKLNYFKLTYSYSVSTVWTNSTMTIHEDPRHKKSRKRRKRPKNAVSSARIYLTFF